MRRKRSFWRRLRRGLRFGSKRKKRFSRVGYSRGGIRM